MRSSLLFARFFLIGLAGAPLSVYAAHLEIIDKFITDILKPLANVLMVLATVLFVVGVVEYIAGSSNETARTTGRNHIVWGLVGLAIMISVRFILSILKSIFYPA